MRSIGYFSWKDRGDQWWGVGFSPSAESWASQSWHLFSVGNSSSHYQLRELWSQHRLVRPFPRPLRVCAGKIQLPLKVSGVSPDPEGQISASCCDHSKSAEDHGCFQSHQTAKHNLKCSGGSKGWRSREFAGRHLWTLHGNGVRQRSCRGLAAKMTIKHCTKC